MKFFTGCFEQVLAGECEGGKLCEFVDVHLAVGLDGCFCETSLLSGSGGENFLTSLIGAEGGFFEFVDGAFEADCYIQAVEQRSGKFFLVVENL